MLGDRTGLFGPVKAPIGPRYTSFSVRGGGQSRYQTAVSHAAYFWFRSSTPQTPKYRTGSASNRTRHHTKETLIFAQAHLRTPGRGVPYTQLQRKRCSGVSCKTRAKFSCQVTPTLKITLSLLNKNIPHQIQATLFQKNRGYSSKASHTYAS